jgi:hypothetical protein
MLVIENAERCNGQATFIEFTEQPHACSCGIRSNQLIKNTG